MSILQELHDSEINASIASFHADAWTVKLGDELNGFVAENVVWSEAEAHAWLATKVREIYPTSKWTVEHPA